MNERLQFVQDAQCARFTMAEFCARYGVSRKTGYTWIARHAEVDGAGSVIAVGRRTRARMRSPR